MDYINCLSSYGDLLRKSLGYLGKLVERRTTIS